MGEKGDTVEQRQWNRRRTEDVYWRDPCGMACIQAVLLRSVEFKEGGVQVFIERMEEPFVHILFWYPAFFPSGLFDLLLFFSCFSPGSGTV